MTADFIGELRVRMAAVSASPSALRNMVGPGGVIRARNFLSSESILKRLSQPHRFEAELDDVTQELAAVLPKRKLAGGHAWGPARKVLNIFLGESTYNTHLREAYCLTRVEALLEVPLDSFVANGIAKDAAKLSPAVSFDRWRGVVHVTPELNSKYQKVAQAIAREWGYHHRVFLDLRYWLRPN